MSDFLAVPTVRLDPRDLKVTWPIVIASLEQLSDWAALALRLRLEGTATRDAGTSRR